MKVKRYLVGDLPEAVQLIRSELGSDAVILNTKEIRTGGFLGMFRKKRVEVIAAVDEGTATKPNARAAPARPAPRVDQATSFPTVDDPLPIDQPQSPMLPPGLIRQRYGGAPDRTPAPLTRSQAGEQEVAQFSDLVAAALAEPEAQLAQAPLPKESTNVLMQKQAPTVAKPAHEQEASELLAELRAMKDMMQRANREQARRGMPEHVLTLAKRLALQGVEPAYVEAFAEALSTRVAETASESNEEAIFSEAKQILREWLAPSIDGGISPATRIVHFVGPTGVGKTTTIAKLAADQAFSHRRAVGFITADTYRIAAVDQLRTYADILNMPLEVVFSPSELTRAYKKLEDRDLLLMDTAGRNYRNELYVSEVNSLLSPSEEAEKILVLSLTHKFSDMRQVAAHFRKYGVNRLLLTKMDETDSYGAILNLVREFEFRIPYVTFGQTVPDDIKAFDPELILTKLLEEAAHE